MPSVCELKSLWDQLIPGMYQLPENELMPGGNFVKSFRHTSFLFSDNVGQQVTDSSIVTDNVNDSDLNLTISNKKQNIHKTFFVFDDNGSSGEMQHHQHNGDLRSKHHTSFIISRIAKKMVDVSKKIGVSRQISRIKTKVFNFSKFIQAIFAAPAAAFSGGIINALKPFLTGSVTPKDISLGMMDDGILSKLENSLIPAPQNPQGWIRSHNWSLDQGQKFMIHSKSRMIYNTDLFDLYKWGCYTDDYQTKYWWHHPEFLFGTPLEKIRISLVDNTTGYEKWDAIYDLGGKPKLEFNAQPLGGNRPFFAPDWCPPGFNGTEMGGGLQAKTYTLTVKNLSSKPHPGIDTLGKLIFVRYPLSLLEASYDPHEGDFGFRDIRPWGTADVPGLH